MQKIKNRTEYLLKHNLVAQKIYIVVMSGFFKLIGCFLRTDNRLILFNGHGSRYNDSPKAIYLRMLNYKMFKDFKFVWALDDPSKYDIPVGQKVRMDSLHYFIIALRSKYWVSCVNIERGLKFKKKNTIYLNTWHGIPIKKIGNAVNNRSDFDFSHINLFCYSSKYDKEIYLKDFNVSNKNLIFSGLPRNEELFNNNEEEKKMIIDKLNIPSNKKVILYAPTWRDSDNKGESYNFSPPLNFQRLKKEFENEYLFLFRTHTYTDSISGIDKNDFVYNVTEYENVNDLLKIADILISDYSATIFDYSILEKPIFSFAYDYIHYRETRGFYLDLEKVLPNGVIKSEDELIDKIKNINYIEQCKLTRYFKDSFIETGKNATDICIKKIFELDKLL